MGEQSSTTLIPTPVESKKQTVWIVRYGLTKYPLIEHFGPFNSPLDPTVGIEHAQAIASRIRTDVLNFCPESEPVHVYSSPFTRTAQTAQIIASNLPCEAKVRIEEGLTEWQQKSLLVEPNGIITYPNSKDELSADLKDVDLNYESVNPQASCSPPKDDEPSEDSFVEESEEELFQRCSTTVDRILMERARDGESFVIVSHAPCDQSMAVYFEGKTLSTSALSAWPLGGITRFSRVLYHDGSFGKWEMEMYGNTEHMPGEYQPGLKAWSLPLLAKVFAVEYNLDGTLELPASQ